MQMQNDSSTLDALKEKWRAPCTCETRVGGKQHVISFQWHLGITESSRLENTFRIIKSNDCHSHKTTSLPECHIYMCQRAHGSVFWTKNRNLFMVLTEGLESVEMKK